MLFIIILILLINIIIGLNTNDFCHLSGQEFSDKCNTKSDIKFSNSSKIKSLNYRCGSNLCSSDKTSCLEYRLNIGVFGYTYVLNEFRKKFKTCPVVKTKLNQNDFCSNLLNCKRRKHNPFSKVPKIFSCFCTGNYPYECGKYICSLNQKVCNNLQKIVQEVKLNRFQKCEKNHKMVVKIRF